MALDKGAAAQQVSKANECAQALEQLMQQEVATLLQTLGTHWQGEAATLFASQLQQSQATTNEVASAMRNYASQVEAAAARIALQEQLEAERIARALAAQAALAEQEASTVTFETFL